MMNPLPKHNKELYPDNAEDIHSQCDDVILYHSEQIQDIDCQHDKQGSTIIKYSPVLCSPPPPGMCAQFSCPPG